MSLDVFSRAKRSTYDKRVVLEKRRNLAAAKVNKYRKTQNRLGDSVVVSDAFDPAKYAARLDAFDASSDLPQTTGSAGGGTGGEPRRVRQAMATFRRFIARRSGSKAEKSREREKRRLLS